MKVKCPTCNRMTQLTHETGTTYPAVLWDDPMFGEPRAGHDVWRCCYSDCFKVHTYQREQKVEEIPVEQRERLKGCG
jgi:hypothetical protein